MNLKYRSLTEADLNIARLRTNQSLNGSNKIVELNPKELLASLGLWFKIPRKELNSKEEIIAFILKNGGDDDESWNNILSHEVPPVVVVGNDLVDGIHRCIISVVLKKPVMAVVF